MNKDNLIATILNETGAHVFNLGTYSYDERLAYVSMVTSLAWADGSIDSREMEIIEAISKAAGEDIHCKLDSIISANKVFDLTIYDRHVKCINDQSLKIALMVDLFLTSFADTVCMQSETIYMKYVAGKLGVSDSLYNIIRKNVEDFLNEKNGTGKAITYENGLANETENRGETENECVLRKLVNSLVKSLVLAL